MKTTLVIDDVVLQQLKREAAREGKTISEMVESALRLFLDKKKEPSPALPPLPVHHGGGLLVDIADRDALYRAMEEG